VIVIYLTGHCVNIEFGFFAVDESHFQLQEIEKDGAVLLGFQHDQIAFQGGIDSGVNVLKICGFAA
jgi:hypothetical protein